MTDELKSEFLMEFNADLEEAQAIGNTPHRHRRIVYVKGGEFAGPKLWELRWQEEG